MLLFANNAISTLRAPVLSSDDMLLLQIGDGELFPPASIDTGDTFLATLQDNAGRIEVVEVRRRVGDTLSLVLRGVEGTPKNFEAGTTIAMRVSAELLRRVSADTLRGVAGGVAPLDEEQRLPVDYLPLEAITETLGDARYVQLSLLGEPNQPPRLGATGLLLDEVIPPEIVRYEGADDRYVRSSQLGQPDQPPKLNAEGKLDDTLLSFDPAVLATLAPKNAPTFTGIVRAGQGVIDTLAVDTLAAAESVTTSTLLVEGAATFNEGVAIRGGSVRGKLTVSVNEPSGTPEDGDEWVQYT